MAHVLLCHEGAADNGFVSEILSEEGYDVVSVEDPRDALKELSSAKFRVLLMGIRGEIERVKEFILLIKTLHRDLALITIVDDDSIEIQKMIRKQKVFYHLVRPLEKAEILAAVRNALARA